MSKGTVLDPCAAVTAVQDPAGPPAGSLAGKTVGFRIDSSWTSWTWVADEWAQLMEAHGAKVRVWQQRSPVGKQAEMILAELDEFLAGIDCAVVGLCNCGACTMWTVHDATRALSRGLPTVVISTEHFVGLARTLAKRRGRDEIRLCPLPFPLEGRSEDETRAIAREKFDDMLDALGAKVGATV